MVADTGIVVLVAHSSVHSDESGSSGGSFGSGSGWDDGVELFVFEDVVGVVDLDGDWVVGVLVDWDSRDGVNTSGEQVTVGQQLSVLEGSN